MGNVTESIFSGKTTIIPMADVQHIEKRFDDYKQMDGKLIGYIIVTKHTTWDSDNDFWANNIYLDKKEGELFMKAWCAYRSELEKDTLATLSPSP